MQSIKITVAILFFVAVFLSSTYDIYPITQLQINKHCKLHIFDFASNKHRITTMTEQHIILVTKTWQIVAQQPLVAGQIFYNRLFEIEPSLQHLFKTGIVNQSDKLMHVIGYVVGNLAAPENVLTQIKALAKRHVQYGVKDKHYIIVGTALIWSLEKVLNEIWDNNVKEAWTACYSLLAETMIAAANESPVIL